MSRWMKLLKTEMDVEFFSAVHWVSIAWCYTLIRYLFQKDGMGFWIFTEMGVVAYLMGWGQKMLYVNEKIYAKINGVLRRIFWVVIPMSELILAQVLFSWFQKGELAQIVLYNTILLFFYILLEILIYYVYKEDTKILNELLKDYQKDDIAQK